MHEKNMFDTIALIVAIDIEDKVKGARKYYSLQCLA